MKFAADFHIHSKYSRAVSPLMDLDNLDSWAKIKGIKVLGTGDFTHPKWFEEIKKEIEYLFDKALNSGLTEQEKIHIKSKLEEVCEDFVRECKNFIGSINSLSPAEIATRVISQVIKKAKDERRDQAPIKNEEIGLMKRELPGAGAYYEFLMKSKLPNSRNLNEEKLLHDQRDWNLFFYAGKDNIYIVTQETKIRKLGLKNVISMEEYLSKELSLSAYLSIRKIIAKIFFWK